MCIEYIAKSGSNSMENSDLKDVLASLNFWKILVSARFYGECTQ